MKMKSFKNLLRIAPCLLALTAACSRDDRNNPGHSYVSDMARAIPYEYYSENPNYADGKTAQLPVRGAIPRGHIPFQYSKTIEEQKRAGVELVNPVANSSKQIAGGKEKYEMYCSMCHGPHGEGNGYLVTTKKITKEVTSLVKDYVQNKPDGELYHVLTLGSVSGFMGAYNWQLKPEERWRIIRYIKSDLKNK